MTMRTAEQAQQTALKAERVRSLIATADKRIAQLQQEAVEGNGDLVSVHAHKIQEMLTDPDVAMEVRQRCSEKLKLIQREAYEKDVDTVLNVAIRDARRGDLSKRKEMLLKGREAFVSAVRLGAGDEFKRLVRMKMDIIMSTSGHGRSEKAKQDVAETSAPREPSEKEKMRRFIRFRDPTLLVAIGGQTKYETIDWSLAGLRVRDYPHALRVGTPIPITITLDEDSTLTLPLNAVVVRYNPVGGKLGIKFTSSTSAMLALMKRLQELEIQPLPV